MNGFTAVMQVTNTCKSAKRFEVHMYAIIGPKKLPGNLWTAHFGPVPILSLSIQCSPVLAPGVPDCCGNNRVQKLPTLLFERCSKNLCKMKPDGDDFYFFWFVENATSSCVRLAQVYLKKGNT